MTTAQATLDSAVKTFQDLVHSFPPEYVQYVSLLATLVLAYLLFELQLYIWRLTHKSRDEKYPNDRANQIVEKTDAA